jgi:hypothetical protein
MFLNFKGQVEVKVQKGQKDRLANQALDDLTAEVNRTIQQFLRDNGQDPEGYCFQVKVSTSPMRV